MSKTNDVVVDDAGYLHEREGDEVCVCVCVGVYRLLVGSRREKALAPNGGQQINNNLALIITFIAISSSPPPPRTAEIYARTVFSIYESLCIFISRISCSCTFPMHSTMRMYMIFHTICCDRMPR
jgi:hypothetical protein